MDFENKSRHGLRCVSLLRPNWMGVSSRAQRIASKDHQETVTHRKKENTEWFCHLEMYFIIVFFFCLARKVAAVNEKEKAGTRDGDHTPVCDPTEATVPYPPAAVDTQRLREMW